MDLKDAMEGVWEEAGVDELVEDCDSLELLRDEIGERPAGVLLEEGEVDDDCGMARVTIFTPRLVLVLAGVKSVA